MVTKPDLANVYTINTTGVRNDFLLTFYYEWLETDESHNIETKKEKIASVVLSMDDAAQLTETLIEIKAKLAEGSKDE